MKKRVIENHANLERRNNVINSPLSNFDVSKNLALQKIVNIVYLKITFVP